MSLSFRLNLLIAVLFVLVLLIGTVLVILNARKAVSQEMESSANLALQFLTALTITHNIESQPDLQSALIANLSKLDRIRHLNMVLIGPDQQSMLPVVQGDGSTRAHAPAWFTHLVAPAPMEYRRKLSGPDQSYTEIAIRPDPVDEIGEAWSESRVVLSLLFLFAALAVGLIFITLSRALKPIDRILDVLNVIERGDYRARLPQFNLPELSRIAQRINHMAQTLEQEQQQNRELTKRTLGIQEEERRRLAHELHDELGQSITAIKAVAVAIGQHKDVTGTPVKENAKSIVSICDHVYATVRNMMNRLRPVVLDVLGLVTALHRAVDGWNAYHDDVTCRLLIQGRLNSLSDEINISLYRIVQECLTNVAKHANASRVDVDIQLSHSERRAGKPCVLLEIKDNGIGFNSHQTRRGLGLLGMRERVNSLNGEVRIDARPHAGVAIHISIPVESREDLTEFTDGKSEGMRAPTAG